MELKVLDQVRQKYKKAAEKYGEKFFNLTDLQRRINHLLENQGSLELFVRDEIEFYEKTMRIVKNKEEELKRKQQAQQKLQSILDLHDEKIRKYRDIFFDASASPEVRKMVGAVTDWYEISIPLLRYLYRGAAVWPELTALQAELERFYVPPTGTIPVFLRHYAEEAKMLSPEKKENADRKLLQTCANTLYRIETAIKTEINQMTDFQKNRMITMNSGFEPSSRDHWAHKKESEAITECLNSLCGIIDDFRLRNLSELGFKNKPV